MVLENNRYPIVSVIMGIYNCAETLPKAVECIQNQTFKNWELIMCDDCSHDNTYETACKLAASDNRVIVLKNDTNLTLAPTLNKCLNIAQGKYIARMDGDDTCSSDRLEKEVLFLEGNPDFAVVSCNMSLSSERGVFREVKYKERPIIKDFIYGNQHCHAGCMVRMDALRSVGGYSESLKCKRVEDYDLWVRMYKTGYRGYNLQETLYNMFDSEKALKRRSLSNRINESRVILKACQAGNVGMLQYFRVVVPLLKWFIPTEMYKRLHTSKSRQKD